MKNAIIRWKQKSTNPKFQKAPMQVEHVLEIGEGPHFIHIFIEPDHGPLLEVNLRSEDVESVTLFDVDALVQSDAPVLLDRNGNPVGVDPMAQPPVDPKEA